VPELAANDKIPGEYLRSVDETGAGVGTRYLWIEALKASAAGDLAEDTEVREIFSDADALVAYGPHSEGYRMCLRALRYGVPILASAHSISGGVPATATVTISGTWTAAGAWYGRLGGRPIGPIGVASGDGPGDVGTAIADFINADPAFAATAAGEVDGDDWVITLTAGSDGSRGNALTIWQDTSNAPSGLTSELAGGGDLASGGVYFTDGSGTEDVSGLLTETFAQEFYTQASSVRDSTNLGHFEDQIDAKLGPLEGRLECFVGALVDTLSASGSIAQDTLNDGSFQILWMDESETPGEEIAAGVAALRHLAESASNAMDPNQRYDDVLLDWIQPQEAPGVQPARAILVAALNYGLTPLATRHKRVHMVRAVTTRTLTDDDLVDDGTIDVGTDRTSKRYREELRNTLRQHRADHRFLDNNPAEGEEPTVGKDTTFPKRAEDVIKAMNVRLKNRGWITQIDRPENQPRCALNPDSSTPRLIAYAPHVPRPLFHQTEGTVAKKKFIVAETA
jgi:phage tail sheath gpL-like